MLAAQCSHTIASGRFVIRQFILRAAKQSAARRKHLPEIPPICNAAALLVKAARAPLYMLHAGYSTLQVRTGASSTSAFAILQEFVIS